MNTERRFPDAGWWVKFDRACKHLDEYQCAIAEYTAGRKHPVVGSVESKKQPVEWVYRVRPETEPDPLWAVPIGDFLFNTRASLDHMAVALNGPKMKNNLIYYPIFTEDPFRREQGTRCYVDRDPEKRRNYAHWLRRMPTDAQAFIKRTQPYAMAYGPAMNPADHVLAILKRLNDTDKHRRLLVARHGMDGGRLLEPIPGGLIQESFFIPPPGVAAINGAVIARRPDKVDMDFMGSLCVGLGRSLDTIHESKTFYSIKRFVQEALTFLETTMPPPASP